MLFKPRLGAKRVVGDGFRNSQIDLWGNGALKLSGLDVIEYLLFNCSMSGVVFLYFDGCALALLGIFRIPCASGRFDISVYAVWNPYNFYTKHLGLLV